MGLNITHQAWAKDEGAWTGGYRAFNEWRWMLAEIGRCDTGASQVSQATLLGDWEEFPDDPLEILLAHSDCNGHINRC